MQIKENPEYEDAQFEAVVLDKDGIRMAASQTCLVFGRLKPPRYKPLPDGTLVEVDPYLPADDMPAVNP